MENAGRGCAEKLVWHSAQSEISNQAALILCGPGNNGGDGFVMARHLSNAGVTVKVALFRRPEEYTGDALTNLNALSQLRLPVVEFDPNWDDAKLNSFFSKVKRDKTTWVVDALLGTGAEGEPRAPMARAIKVANGLDVRRMAIDIPTGLDCDSGNAANGTFAADLTCTFFETKKGFGNPQSEKYTGVVTVVDIGAPGKIVGEILGDGH